jgi:hypothetical protein
VPLKNLVSLETHGVSADFTEMLHSDFIEELRNHFTPAMFTQCFDIFEFWHIKKSAKISEAFSIDDRVSRICHSFSVKKRRRRNQMKV